MRVVLKDWQLPQIGLLGSFPAGRAVTAKARTFTEFVREIMPVRGGANSKTS